MLKFFFKDFKKYYYLWVSLMSVVFLVSYLNNSIEQFFDILLLSGYILISVTFFGYFRWIKRKKQLQCLKQRYQVKSNLNQSSLEDDYQQLITKLQKINQVEIEKNLNLTQEILEDYSIWLHQIKTPLAALDLMVQSQNFDKKEMQKRLFEIEQYLSLLLSYLKQQFDNNDLLFESLNLDYLVKEVVKKYALFFVEKKLQVEFKNLNNTVISDAKWLSFILEQVIFNALKYTKRGKITFIFEKNTLIIKDTGIGIKNTDLPRIFEKGFTGYNGRHNQNQASGLGLYLSKKIAYLLGCTLKIESKIEEGTSVFIGFPQK